MREVQYQPIQYRNDRNIVSFYSFAGGIFDTKNSDRLADNEVADMINLDIVNDGSLKMRDNFVASDLSPTTVDGTKSYADVCVFDTGAGYEIIGIYNNNIVKIPSNEVLFSNFGTSMSSVQYQGLLYMLGNGHLLVYDGTATKDISVYYAEQLESLIDAEKINNDLNKVKNGTIMAIAQGSLVIAGIVGDPNTIYVSNPFEPYLFDGRDNKDKIRPVHSDNDRITALVEYSDGLMVFKRETIYLISGLIAGSNTQMFKLNVPTGTMSPKTINIVDNFLMFLGTDRKVYGLYGGSYYSTTKDKVTIYLLSGTINNILQRISTIDREKVVATYYNGVYIIAYPYTNNNGETVTETVNMYVLDKATNDILERQAWSRYNHVDIKGFIVIPGQDLNMYSTNSTRLYKFKEDDTADYDIYGKNPTTHLEQYEVYIKFKSFNIELPESYKIFRAGWIQFSKVFKEDFKDFKHNIYIDDKLTYLPYLEDMQVDQFDETPERWSSTGAQILWDDFYWAGRDNSAYYFRINAKGRTAQNELKFKTYGAKLRILGTSFELKVKYPQRNNFNTGFKRGN